MWLNSHIHILRARGALFPEIQLCKISPSNLRARLNMQLYRYLTTFPLFPSHFRAVLHMLQQLYRSLATFPLFPSNLRAFLNMLKQLYRYLGSILSFLSNL